MNTWSWALAARFRRAFAERKVFFVQALTGLVVVCVTLWACLFSDYGKVFDLGIISPFFSIRGPRPPPSDVVLAVLTDETNASLDLSPRLEFPRQLTAQIFEKIISANPKIIIADQAAARENVDPIADEQLITAIRSGPVTMFSGLAPQRGYSSDDRAQRKEGATKLHRNDPRVEAAAKLALNMWFLDDSLDDSGRVYRLAASDSLLAPIKERFPTKYALEKIAGMDLDEPGVRDLINFYGKTGVLERIPWETILNADQSYLREKFYNKVVITGLVSTQKDRDSLAKDEFYVPVGNMFGAEIHAVITANILDRSWIRRLEPVEDFVIVGMLSLLVASVGLILRFKYAVLWGVTLSSVTTVTCYLSFKSNLWLPLVGPVMLSSVLMILANLVIGYFLSEKKNKRNESFFDFDTEDE